jgi:hypothetical protein
MAVLIRQAAVSDAPQWLGLLKSVLGEEYPAKTVYDPAWIASQLNPASDHETWVALVNNRLQASIAVLPPLPKSLNPITNLGRILFRPESYADGSAESLLRKIDALAFEQGHLVVGRVLNSDQAQQHLFENLGYVCVGFQPAKHLLRVHEGVLFYVRIGRPELISRLPPSESLPQINELATFVLSHLNISLPLAVRDGMTGYPLQTDLTFRDTPIEDFEAKRKAAQSAHPLIEVSTGYNLGRGLLRIAPPAPTRCFLAYSDDRLVAGLAYCFDDTDRCLRIVDTFAADDLSTGALFYHALQVAQAQFNAIYVEADVLLTAPRLLKSAEQLGFVPVAYLPAFYYYQGRCADVAKMVKLNLIYSLGEAPATTQARSVVEIVDRNFQEQKVGLAVINLLRSLPFFAGLGDGELRKIARLFTQKLYRPGEVVFKQGDQGNEAYVVMRGQIDILLEDRNQPIASVTNGQVLGEQAFLDGTQRAAKAVAVQASILLVVQRSAFNELVQREPHLGMVVMRNMALDLSNKLRRATVLMAGAKK